MAAVSPASPSPRPDPDDALPVVRLEVRSSAGVTSYPVGDTGFLLGSVPGCDLRLPGTGLPPVLALVARQPDGVRLRKLAPLGALLLNGQPITDALLNNGDQLTIGTLEVAVRITSVPVLRVKLFDEAQEASTEDQLREQEQALDEERANLASLRHQLSEREQQLEQQQQELTRVRQEIADIRQQLYQRYQQRRERLAQQQESLRRNARKLQKRRRLLKAELQQARVLRSSEGAVEAELRARANQLVEVEQRLKEREETLIQREKTVEAELGRRLVDLTAREKRLDEERQALARSQSQHQTDLVRLDRLAAVLEQRQRQMQKSALEVDRRYEALQKDTRDLEEQAAHLDEAQDRLREENQALLTQKREADAARAELAARTAALEGQQAMLASLRTRLERLREEHRRREQELDEQSQRQQEAEGEIQSRLVDARRLSLELQAEKKVREEQQKQFEERKATLEAAVQQLRQAQERLVEENRALEQRRQEQEDLAARQAEQEALLSARTQSVEEERERLRKERQILEERVATLQKAEQVMTALQEQIRKRNDELADRQRRLEENQQSLERERAALDNRSSQFDQVRQEAEQKLGDARGNLERERGELTALKTDLEQREQSLRGEVQEVIQAKELLAATRLQMEEEKRTLEGLQERALTETMALRAQAETLRQELPVLEDRASEAQERLTQAREQLRGHLSEIHEYVRQGRSDLEGLRDGIAQDQARLREQEQHLYQARDAHRLAVAEFRQQMADWQAQIAELKRALAQGEDRLERRLAEVEERARQIDDTSRQLAQKAEEIQQQEHQVVERRQEVDRHLTDMREWYRKKIRELSGIDQDPLAGSKELAGTESEESRSAFATTRPVEAGDRQLGDLLRSLELIDADTLGALLDEARQQRRSLRQLLLQGGYLTLFQMALIEAGNLDGLVLGPVRVIDRLRATPREAAYRVFDPRTERECLLRLLAESELQDAVRPDEFRQRFVAASEVRHPNVAGTWEVLEIAGRPAVLQEWLDGLPSSDWPALAAVPGVWFRLMSQAALGLRTAHEAGLIHGHLHPSQVVMTPEGVLKLCGMGEPAWLDLVSEDTDQPRGATLAEPTIEDDLKALGRCALAWSLPASEKKNSRTKPLPESLQTLLQRLIGETEPAFSSAAALLEELDSAGAAVPANAAAWDRFVKHVRDQSANSPLRRSA